MSTGGTSGTIIDPGYRRRGLRARHFVLQSSSILILIDSVQTLCDKLTILGNILVKTFSMPKIEMYLNTITDGI